VRKRQGLLLFRRESLQEMPVAAAAAEASWRNWRRERFLYQLTSALQRGDCRCSNNSSTGAEVLAVRVEERRALRTLPQIQMYPRGAMVQR
jgi:hypothetical protein